MCATVCTLVRGLRAYSFALTRHTCVELQIGKPVCCQTVKILS